MKRTLVMLASDYNPLKFKLVGSYMSEKLDGIRAIWLPFTRGLNFKAVPWANTQRDDRNPNCSGLWTRRGKNIAAPHWFLDKLPQDMPLDGELFRGRGLFQATMSTVRKLEPVDSEWQGIEYKVFDIPGYKEFFRIGQVREGGKAGDPAYEVFFKADWPDTMFTAGFLKGLPNWEPKRFSSVVSILNPVWGNEVVSPALQVQLPHTDDEAIKVVGDELEKVTKDGAEGLMVRRAHSLWEPVRSHEIVKIKKLLDDEAQVIGYCYGVGKYQGMIGAIRLRWNPVFSKGPVLFDLSGFTDAERQIDGEILETQSQLAVRSEATSNQGKYVTLPLSKQFPIGSTVTFKYNDVSDDGKPRFARYFRKYQPL